MQARLLYRDGLMLVIDKPAGFAVHKGPKGGESLEDYFDALRFGLPRAPALAHRLDRDTSGCLVLGRHRKALAELGRLFKSGRVGKTYWAIVEVGPQENEGRIELPLGRKDASRGWWMKHDPHGQSAITSWKVIGRAQETGEAADGTAAGARFRPDASAACRTGAAMKQASEEASLASGKPSGSSLRNKRAIPCLTWLALEPVTGRTHQLRVHCAAMGWPIVGDSIYGTAPRSSGPSLHLHSREIVVPLYKNREPVRVTAPVPLHMQERLETCGWEGELFRLVD